MSACKGGKRSNRCAAALAFGAIGFKVRAAHAFADARRDEVFISFFQPSFSAWGAQPAAPVP